MSTRQQIYYVIYRSHVGDSDLGKGINDDLLLTSLTTLRYLFKGEIYLVSPELSGRVQTWVSGERNIKLRQASMKQWENRRMCCKIELLYSILEAEDSEAQVIMGDVDVIFLGNPFEAFHEFHFDLGLTSRCYKYRTPVNGGMVYLRNSEGIRNYVRWAIDQMKNPTWQPYLNTRRHRGLDWYCDQDILVAIYRNKDEFEEMLNIKVIDIGFKYNYCTGTDVQRKAAFALMKEAYLKRKYPVLHFKTALKRLIYEPWFKDLVK